MAVFVLDDFDMFAAKARQTVLYNLLDCMQAPDIQARCIASYLLTVAHPVSSPCSAASALLC